MILSELFYCISEGFLEKPNQQNAYACAGTHTHTHRDLYFFIMLYQLQKMVFIMTFSTHIYKYLCIYICTYEHIFGMISFLNVDLNDMSDVKYPTLQYLRSHEKRVIVIVNQLLFSSL